MVLGIEHRMRYTVVSEHVRQLFALFHGGGADKHGLTALITFFDVRNDRAQFARNGFVNLVVFVDTLRRKVGRNHHDVESVDTAEFAFLRLCRTRHAAELFVKTEIVLERDCGERLVFVLNADVFFRFDCLMKSVAVTASYHKSSRKLVDYDDFAVVYDVIRIALHDIVGADCIIYIMV